METELSVSLVHTVQHAKDCIVGEDLVLNTKQVVILRALSPGQTLLCMAP